MSDENKKNIRDFKIMIEKLRKTPKSNTNIKTMVLFLKSLIEMGWSVSSTYDRSAFLDIFKHMRKSDPEANYPSYSATILQRYGFLRDIGSNKYPEWNIPEEKRDIISKFLNENN